MQQVRIIPCLDVTQGRVVKGVSFLELRDAGDPVAMGEHYSEAGADELVYLDITATTSARTTMVDLAAQVAERALIPFTVGGGVDSLAVASSLLRVGADKVSVNSAAVRDPHLIREIADVYGNQCVVVAIDVRRTRGDYEVVTHGGTRPTGLELSAWLDRVQQEGAGELLVTSMDQDGQQAGYDRALYAKVLAETDVPVIASGGVGSLDDFLAGATLGVQGLLAASVFHFGTFTVGQVKEYLGRAGVVVRSGDEGA
ncbi:imidazole glycerol phosphate synthase subunit HisF [Ferrimicrobium sp.]|uniref:imidazole glycerol phosphate synthase subunit HisF n=1 Tax=Ferrimicrobium sp. TaxID=2926050 RepID=UPI00261DA01F|nr:imidazole glycerol phosphate synthase subunit HisF [Ferrimicrobium sp.]